MIQLASRLRADRRQRGSRVARSLRGAGWKGFIQPAKFIGAETDGRGSHIFDEALSTLGAGDWHDIRSSREHPGERELGGRAALLRGDAAHFLHEAEIQREVFSL